MKEITRRRFMLDSGKGLAGAVAGTAVLTALNHRMAAGANERLQLALIGCGGRGRTVCHNMIEQGAEIACLCDLHPQRLEEALADLGEAQPRKPKTVKNTREVWDDKGIDAVVIATPDHWHAPLAIEACRAGKDVYVEKPHAHNIWESRKLVEAARKYNRIVQAGTQNRSAPYNRLALEYIKSGQLGKIVFLQVYNLESGSQFKMGEPGEKHPEFDWDHWLGPAPERPWHEKLFEGGWHHYWDFSGGDIIDDGIHQVDLALMVMGDPGMPKVISASGGKMAYPKADGDVPDVQVVAYEFDDFILTFELTQYPKYMEKASSTIRRNDLLPYWTTNADRIEFYGSEFLMTLGRHGGGWIVQTKGGKEVTRQYGRPGDAPHAQNFIESVKSRNKPNADIEIAHTACTIVHLGNIAYRVKDQKLRYDAAKECFIGSPEADKLLKRDYRPKYAVPEKV